MFLKHSVFNHIDFSKTKAIKRYTSVCKIALIGTLAAKGPLQVPKAYLDCQEGFLVHPKCPVFLTDTE